MTNPTDLKPLEEEKKLRCPFCEPYGEVCYDKASYKTKVAFYYNNKPAIAVCSNGHVFSLWDGEE